MFRYENPIRSKKEACLPETRFAENSLRDALGTTFWACIEFSEVARSKGLSTRTNVRVYFLSFFRAETQRSLASDILNLLNAKKAYQVSRLFENPNTAISVAAVDG